MATPSDLSSLSPSAGIVSLRGRFPQPTNAQALAALEGVPQWNTSTDAVSAGVPTNVAVPYLPPDGIFPRMRMLAAGWTKPGDTFQRPDAKWWGQPYRHSLWEPLLTYAKVIDNVSDRGVTWDEALARGDIAELSQSITLIAEEARDVFEAPCPKWLIPPSKGQLPIPNPECMRKEIDKRKQPIKDLLPRRQSDIGGLLLVIAGGYLLLSKGD